MAAYRYRLLYLEGPTPHAFEFRKPFGPQGKPLHIDRKLLKDKIFLFENLKSKNKKEMRNE